MKGLIEKYGDHIPFFSGMSQWHRAYNTGVIVGAVSALAGMLVAVILSAI